MVFSVVKSFWFAAAPFLLGVACSSPPRAKVTAADPAAPTVAAAPVPARTTKPPAAPVREVRDTYFGTTVVDPYRWMESDSPELAAWMKAQADFARTSLDALPLRGPLRARVASLDNASPRVRGVTRRPGGKYFYSIWDPGAESPRLCVRQGTGGAERTLVDAASLGEGDKRATIDYYEPSPDGHYVAYGVAQGGNEMSVLHVVDAESGETLPEAIERARFAGVSWKDTKSFFYRRHPRVAAGAPETARLTGSRVYLHTLRADPEAEVAVFGPGVSPAVDAIDSDFPAVTAASTSAYLVAQLYHGVKNDVTLYAAPRRAYRGALTPWKKIVDVGDEVVDFTVKGNEIFVLSQKGAPRRRLLRFRLDGGSVADAQEVLPQGDVILRGAAVGADAVYVGALDGGIDRVLRLPFPALKSEVVAVPAGASAGWFSVHEKLSGALVFPRSWTSPVEVDLFDPASKTLTNTGLLPPSPVSFANIVAEEVQAISADGTAVPLSILRAKGLSLDGSHPAYLHGYGAYGNVVSPFFDTTSLAWLERGGVLAYCHPRGGGEYGEEWHRAGMLGAKPNTIKDFVACAQYLVDKRYTAPARLGGEGTSAGGMLIGGAITARPELFGAAVIRVAMTNALRFEHIPIGPFNTSEFGTVKTEEGFRALLAVDAFHHIKDGVTYPAALITTGAADPRVSPWQSAKLAARLQAATAGDEPVLLRVDYGAGHSGSPTRSQYLDELADTYAFLFARLAGGR